MPIYAPGVRDRNNKRKGGGKRNLVAILSLTAMVDMFTVLVVFLLQNYDNSVEIIPIPKEVQLPQASAVKELKPSHVVTVSSLGISLDTQMVAPFQAVREQEDWMIPGLYNAFKAVLSEERETAKKSLKNQFEKAVKEAKRPESAQEESPDPSKVTLQAHKEIDFLSIKKILFTLTEAGASEINFAVIQAEKPTQP